MVRTRSILSLAALTFLGATAACSSSETSVNSVSDAGTGSDATTLSDGAGPTGTDDSSTATPEGGFVAPPDGGFPEGGSAVGVVACNAYVRFSQACAGDDAGKSAACSSARTAACGSTLTYWTPEYQDAYASCVPSAVDVDGGGCDNVDACVSRALSVANPNSTAAQNQVRALFCDACNVTNLEDAGTTTCADDFFRIDPAGDNGLGFLILTHSDAVAQKVLSTCTKAALAAALQGDASDVATCSGAFSECVSGVVNIDPPDACNPPSTDDGSSDAGDEGTTDAAPVDAGPVDAGPG